MQDFPTSPNFKESKSKESKEPEVFAGYFSHLQLSDYDKKVFLNSLRSKYRTYMFDFLAAVLSTSDFLKMLDLFAGDTLHFPDREEVYTVLCDSQVYGFIERKQAKITSPQETVPDAIIQSASMAFARPKNQVQKSNDRMKKLATSLKGLNLLDLNSLKPRKKNVYVPSEEESENPTKENLPMLDTTDTDETFGAELPPVAVEDDSDPFADLVPSPAPTPASSTEIVAKPKPKRSLEDSVSTVTREVSGSMSSVLSTEDQVKFADWLSSKTSEPPAAMRLLLANFQQKVGNSMAYQVAESVISAQRVTAYLNKLEQKIFDPANLDRFDPNDTQLLEFHANAVKALQNYLKFITQIAKDHPNIFDMGASSDPNPQIAQINKQLREFSPQQLEKFQDMLDNAGTK